MTERKEYGAEEYGKLAESAEDAANSGRLMMIESRRSMEMVASALRVASRATPEGIYGALIVVSGDQAESDMYATAIPQSPSTVEERVKNKKQYSEWTFAERAKFFAEGKIEWEEFNAPPELNFAPRFRPTIGGKLVRPTGCPEHGYLSVEDALKGGREFQEASRAALDASREK